MNDHFANDAHRSNCAACVAETLDRNANKTRHYNLDSHHGHNITIHNPGYIYCQTCQQEVHWSEPKEQTNYKGRIA